MEQNDTRPRPAPRVDNAKTVSHSHLDEPDSGIWAAMDGRLPLDRIFWIYWAAPFAILAGLFLIPSYLNAQQRNHLPHTAGSISRSIETGRQDMQTGTNGQVGFANFARATPRSTDGNPALVIAMGLSAMLMVLHSAAMGRGKIRATRMAGQSRADAGKISLPGPAKRFLYSVLFILFGGFGSLYALILFVVNLF